VPLYMDFLVVLTSVAMPFAKLDFHINPDLTDGVAPALATVQY
jgi:hypothetical protein